MIRNVVEQIGGIGIYGIVSLVLFLAVFLAMLVWALRLRGPEVDRMRALPLEPDD